MLRVKTIYSSQVIKSILLLLTIQCFISCSDTASQDEPKESIDLLGSVVQQEIFSSSITGIDYPIDVYLPPGYLESSSNFPVIYELDGQWIFEGHTKIIDSLQKNVIFVAIHQGPEERRVTDYLLPGASDYYEFLHSELIPYIESNYKASTENRMLAGASYGGMLVSSVLFMEDIENPYFSNYLSMDAPFLFTHREATLSLEQTRFDASDEMNATLILTSALIRANDASVNDFQQLLESRAYKGLEIIRKSYEVNHFQIANPSFEDAVKLLFK